MCEALRPYAIPRRNPAPTRDACTRGAILRSAYDRRVTEPPAPDRDLLGARSPRIRAEVLIVLALSLGQSSVYSVVQFIDALTRGPLKGQSTALNPTQSDRPVFDAIYQVLPSLFGIVPVLLVFYLLWQPTRPHLERLGIDARRPIADAGVGVLLALVIGAGGIVIYVGGLALDLTKEVQAAPLDPAWWSAPVLILSAFRSGFSEEVIVIAYLFTRLRERGWAVWTIILTAAALRGSYHLYQGVSAFVGNFIMGVIFGWLYSRTRRVLPLVIAHTLINSAVFIGFPWAYATFPQFFRGS